MTNNPTDPLIISSRTEKGEILQATFLPNKGMNLSSFKCGNLEVIDQSTFSLFEERFAGLGALIGPHFHRRTANTLPTIDESLFPHIARIRKNGVTDPFSHGIARYAPWNVTASPTSVKAILTGKDVWNGVPLASLEGQNFTMNFHAKMTPQGLFINLDVTSESDSLVGIHYYYHLPKKSGTITSCVQREYMENGERKPLPSTWKVSQQQELVLNLEEEADFTFFPFPDPLKGNILLDTGSYKLKTTYSCTSQENSWQLYHPKGASFVCIEPISSQDPRHPNLTASSLNIFLEIEG